MIIFNGAIVFICIFYGNVYIVLYKVLYSFLEKQINKYTVFCASVITNTGVLRSYISWKVTNTLAAGAVDVHERRWPIT